MTGEGAATIGIETAKEAFYRTFSGLGELWFSYMDQDESWRREYVDTYWEDFLEYVQEVKDGKPATHPPATYPPGSALNSAAFARSYRKGRNEQN